MSSADAPRRRASGRTVAVVALLAVGALPAYAVGAFVWTIGSWTGDDQYWYGRALVVAGAAMTVAAGLLGFRSGSIWGSLLVASPVLCIALAWFLGASEPLLGLFLSPILVLLGIVLVAGTELRRRDVEDAEERVEAEENVEADDAQEETPDVGGS